MRHCWHPCRDGGIGFPLSSRFSALSPAVERRHKRQKTAFVGTKRHNRAVNQAVQEQTASSGIFRQDYAKSGNAAKRTFAIPWLYCARMHTLGEPPSETSAALGGNCCKGQTQFRLGEKMVCATVRYRWAPVTCLICRSAFAAAWRTYRSLSRSQRYSQPFGIRQSFCGHKAAVHERSPFILNEFFGLVQPTPEFFARPANPNYTWATQLTPSRSLAPDRKGPQRRDLTWNSLVMRGTVAKCSFAAISG